jgi:import inner membrane translocase subunit TIM44
LHKDSKWKEAWTSFKESNPVVQGIFTMRRRYEESDNVLVNTSRVLGDRFREMFGSVFEETEHAQALAEIREIDPSFTLEAFMKEAREFMIPEVLEAYVEWNPKTLKSWCSDAVYSILEASREPLVHQMHTVEGRILDLRNVDVSYK